MAYVDDYAASLPQGQWVGQYDGQPLALQVLGDECTIMRGSHGFLCPCSTHPLDWSGRPPLWQEMPVANGVPPTYQPIYLHGVCPKSLKLAHSPQTNQVLGCWGTECTTLAAAQLDFE